MSISNKKRAINSRSTRFDIEFYTEWSNLSVLLDVIKSISKHYAYIVHDKDIKEDGTFKKSHIHIVLVLEERKTINALFDLLAKYEPSLTKQLIEVCHSLRGSVRYLTHIDYPEKYQYNFDDIKTDSFYWLKDFFNSELTNEESYIKISDFINFSFNEITTDSVYRFAIENGCFKWVQGHQNAINSLIRDHNSKKIDEFDNKVQQQVLQHINHIDKENRIIKQLADTFDEFEFVTDDGETKKIMCVGTKKGK